MSIRLLQGGGNRLVQGGDLRLLEGNYVPTPPRPPATGTSAGGIGIIPWGTLEPRPAPRVRPVPRIDPGEADATAGVLVECPAVVLRLTAGTCAAAAGCVVEVEAPVVPWWSVWTYHQRERQRIEEDLMLLGET